MEVDTNSGALLDCPSPTVKYAVFDYGDDAAGSATPVAAVAATEFDSGIAQVESEGDDTAVIVVRDESDNRIGRAMVTLLDNGWVVGWTERCG